MYDITPKRLLPCLSYILVGVAVGVVMYMLIELRFSLLINMLSLLFSLVVLPFIGLVFYRMGLVAKLTNIWDEIPDHFHIAILAVYALIIYELFLKYIFPMKKQEYEDSR